MLSVSLSGRTQSTRCASGNAGAIYAVSSSLRTDREADDLAIYQGGLWHSVSGPASYDRVSIEHPCRVRFQELSDRGNDLALGPFPALVISRGVIKTTGSRPRVVAIFDESLEQWRAFDDNSYWPVVAIEEALEPSSSAA